MIESDQMMSVNFGGRSKVFSVLSFGKHGGRSKVRIHYVDSPERIRYANSFPGVFDIWSARSIGPHAKHVALWTWRESNPRPNRSPMYFYYHSRSFEIPLPERRSTPFGFGSPLNLCNCHGRDNHREPAKDDTNVWAQETSRWQPGAIRQPEQLTYCC